MVIKIIKIRILQEKIIIIFKLEIITIKDIKIIILISISEEIIIKITKIKIVTIATTVIYSS